MKHIVFGLSNASANLATDIQKYVVPNHTKNMGVFFLFGVALPRDPPEQGEGVVGARP